MTPDALEERDRALRLEADDLLERHGKKLDDAFYAYWGKMPYEMPGE